MRRWHDDDGIATVLVCGAVAVLVAVMGIGVYLGAAVTARHRAGAAADAAALAGAGAVLAGPDAACAAAVSLARENGAELSGCSLVGADVLVTVIVPTRLGPWSGQATAHSRAGPVAAQAP